LVLLSWPVAFAHAQPAPESGGGKRTARLAVKGPVTLKLETMSADVEVAAGRSGQVTVVQEDDDEGEVRLLQRAEDRVEVDGAGGRGVTSGNLRIELPPGSHLDLSTVSGDVAVRGLNGDVRCRTMSGDVRVDGASNVELKTVSGDIRADAVAGAARIKTVSGDVTLRSRSAAPQVDFESTSGDLEFSGGCGAKCRLSAGSVSGTLVLHLAPASSFELSHDSHSGDFEDGLGAQITRRERRFGTLSVRAHYGKGEGVIETRTFSGEVRLTK
jgi:hypothetical protein